ncbi:plasmid partitioning protein RepA [Primorskyibacter sp. 2E107]|uniref:plasmid partitioning protein RepA n=1 Tax=Primorskyibacter sp. 2E107 TaxID=3403458 RepID=UPI003AF639E8
MSESMDNLLQAHAKTFHPPDASKHLREFNMAEAADLMNMKVTTFRTHHAKLPEDLPQGELTNANRRYFRLEEVHQLQDYLYSIGKISAKDYPRRQDGERTQIVSTFNLKGGVAKTSTVIHAATMFAARGYRVLLIDLDAQASATNLLGSHPDQDPDMLTIYDAITFKDPVPIRDTVRTTYFPKLHLIPASMQIMEFEFETALSFQDRTGSTGSFQDRLRLQLETIQEDYDIILFDTPPALNFAVLSSLFASTGVIIPVGASMIDAMSLRSFLDMASGLIGTIEEQTSDHSFNFIKVLITKYEATDNPSVQMAGFLRAALGNRVMGPEFVKSTAISDAANTIQPLIEVDPRDMTRKTYDRAFDSVRRVTDEILREIHRAWGRIE